MTSQHINLLHSGLLRRAEPFTSGHGAVAVAAAVVLTALGAFALQVQARESDARAGALQKDLDTLQTRAAELGSGPPPNAHNSAELQRLRRVEASQRQVRAAIDSGVVGRTQGYAAYFNALSRQSQTALWITGFAVAPDGVALDLQGRMADPRLLPDYLRRLNAEPLFKGREFSQLSVKAVEASPTSAGGYTEFALRGQPTTAEAAR